MSNSFSRFIDQYYSKQDLSTSTKELESFLRKSDPPSLKTVARDIQHYLHSHKNELDQHKTTWVKMALKLIELTSIGKEHKEYFKTTRGWLQYAKENKLPSVPTYIAYFGTFNKAKGIINPVEAIHVNQYALKEIKGIIEAHSDYMTNRVTWDQYASGKGLPLYQTITSYLPWKEAQVLAKVEGIYTDEQMIHIAREHNRFFTSKRKWDSHAKELGLPYSMLYIRTFASWEKAKDKVYARDKLRDILLANKDFIQSQNMWDQHVADKDLPSSDYIISRLGPWEQVISVRD